MGINNFRLSDMMIPNSWFSKLKLKTLISNSSSTTITSKKAKGSPKHHPPDKPIASSSPLITTPDNSGQPQLLQQQQRKSYYFTRHLTTATTTTTPPPPSPPLLLTPKDIASSSSSSSQKKKKPPTITTSTVNARPPATTKPLRRSTCVLTGCSCRSSLQIEPLSSTSTSNSNSTSKQQQQPDSTPQGVYPNSAAELPEIISSTSPAQTMTSACSCKLFNNTPPLPMRSSSKFIINDDKQKQRKIQVSEPTKLPPIKTRKFRTSSSWEDHDHDQEQGRLSITKLYGLKLRTNSPRIGNRRVVVNQTPRKKKKMMMRKRRSLSESFAVVKSSRDPKRDFRESMVEMIAENDIRSSRDLEHLLACYLSLNSNQYHDLIIGVFKQIWFDQYVPYVN